MNEQTGGGAPNTPDSADDGFVIESASVPFEAAPDDTTAHLDREAPPQAQAQAQAGDPADAVADDAHPADEETSGESAGTPAPQAQGQQPPQQAQAGKAEGGSKGKETFGQRIARLKKEVDTLTFSKHQTQREIDAAKAEYARLQAEIESLKRQAGTTPGGMSATAPGQGGSAAPPQGQGTVPPAGSPPAAPEPMPQHPKYRDFATDEEYDAAVVKWHQDMVAWQERRSEALRTSILSEVDQRTATSRAAAAAEVAAQDFRRRLSEVAAKHPNWDEAIKPLQQLRSSWYDPAKHGPHATTPFLSDLAQHHPEGHLLVEAMVELAGSDLESAQRLADLIPSRELRDALLMTPEHTVVPLMKYFATPQGQADFQQLRTMHPMRMIQSLGALSARLATAPRGSVAAPQHPITNAQPSRTATAGTPGARGQGQAPSPTKPNDSFDAWMAAEDEREKAERMRLAGIAAS